MKKQLMALMRTGWKNAAAGELFFKPGAQALCDELKGKGHEAKMLHVKRRAYGAPLYLVLYRKSQ